MDLEHRTSNTPGKGPGETKGQSTVCQSRGVSWPVPLMLNSIAHGKRHGASGYASLQVMDRPARLRLRLQEPGTQKAILEVESCENQYPLLNH